MTAAIYQTGDTIKVTCKFYSFAGVLTDLNAIPTVKVYAADKTTTITCTITVTKTSTGTYSAVVTLPTIEGIYYIAFEGVASDLTAIYHREAFTVKFSSST